MALSEYERKVLAEMEQHLRAQDPALADKMAAPPPQKPASGASSSRRSPRKIALGSILAAAGLTLALVGVGVDSVAITILLGALGFLMMVGGVLYAMSPANAKPRARDSRGSGTRGTKAPEPPKNRDEARKERWQNRN